MQVRTKKLGELLLLAVFAVSISLMSIQCAGTDGGGGGGGDGKKCFDDPNDTAGRCNDPEDDSD